MTRWRMAFQSLVHFGRANLAVAFGVAIATAVLTGALIVGQSMRGSLTELTLERLGQIDEILVSDGFFRAALASEIATEPVFREHYDTALPMILFPNGTLEIRSDDEVRRASGVNVLGVPAEFFELGDLDVDSTRLAGRQMMINQALADELDLPSVAADRQVTLRIPKPTQMPSDSALGRQDDLVEALVGMEIAEVVPNRSLGRFGLHPSQSTAPNLFVPIELIQNALRRGTLSYKGDAPQANVIVLSGREGPPPEEVTEALFNAIQPSLEDHGFAIKRVRQIFPEAAVEGGQGGDSEIDSETIFDYWSLSSDRLVLSDEAAAAARQAFPNATEVFTYLANDIRKAGTESGIPYSMVAALSIGKDFPLVSADSGEPLPELDDGEIVLNQWAADNLGVEVGDSIELTYYEPETTHGNQQERVAQFRLAGVAALTEPSESFLVRRGEVIPARFDRPPTVANDPNLTPEVPGLTDAETMENWDLPFTTTDRIRPVDDEYWNDYRTTPKAFVSLATGQRLWVSRFGKTTSFRIPAAGLTRDEVASRLQAALDASDSRLGFSLVPIKRNGLKASSGSTPFDLLFLALSMFVIVAALILVSLLFRLGLQNRAAEVGLYRAVGFGTGGILGIWLREMVIVCALGAAAGVLLGIAYGGLMVLGLTTWWVEAISEPFIRLHIGWHNLVIGLLSGVAICVVTIAWSLWRTRRESVRSLLAGNLESESGVAKRRGWGGWLVGALLIGAIGLSVYAATQTGDAQAGAFMGSGFLVLAASLLAIYQWLCRSTDPAAVSGMGLGRLALLSGRRNPLRSTLTVGLVAAASFLIVAVSSFRLVPSAEGTAGFDWLASTTQPVFADLNSVAGQDKALGAENRLPADTEVWSFRLKPGEDASCNNVYQSSQPQVLGLTEAFLRAFDDPDRTSFAWAGSLAESPAEQANPWRLLERGTDGEGAIPCVIDKNTAVYSLKIFSVGQIFEADYDTGEKVRFRVVGFLNNTILQGSLLISEQDFENVFPGVGGYRFFLIDSNGPAAVATLEDRLSDQGFDATSAPERLGRFMQVQNAYLGTFQALGALGLLLGTLGLAAVQIRNVVQRKQELGLMRAVGFRTARLSRMVLLENAWLLWMGLLTGVMAAVCATVPHYILGNASVPWAELGLMFLAIAGVGLAVSWLASRRIGKLGLLDSLRA